MEPVTCPVKTLEGLGNSVAKRFRPVADFSEKARLVDFASAYDLHAVVHREGFGPSVPCRTALGRDRKPALVDRKIH